MATAWDCTEPREAWDLVAHFVGNLLCAGIGLRVSRLEGSPTTDEHEILENEISRIRAQLIGFLFVIGRQMHKHCHEEMALKIDTLLDEVVTKDVMQRELLTEVVETFWRLTAMPSPS